MSVDVREFTYDEGLPNLPDGVLAIDLEMANSFRAGPGVICMIGLEHYDRKNGRSHSLIGSVTSRHEEKELIEWMLELMERFYAEHPDATLVTFSGLDNDVRWLNERLVRLDIEPPGESILNTFGHLDLKVEFFKRTQNIKISLKKMEEIFGIQRDSTVTSKKVSYILTDVLRDQQQRSTIPDRLFEYLREDVHHLFLIYNGWDGVSLDHFNMTDREYQEHVKSLENALRKFVGSKRLKNSSRLLASNLNSYLEELRSNMEVIQRERSFRNFELPQFPELDSRHPEYERIRKKYRYLNNLQVNDPVTGAYRLREGLFKFKGALAVVRHEGRLLMIRRADGLARGAGLWGLPGGVVEEGEEFKHTAVRELWEEVGLEGRFMKTMGSSLSHNGEYDLTWVEVEVDDITTLKANPKEVGEIRWVTPEEVAQLEPLIPDTLKEFSNILGRVWGGGG